MEKSVLLILKLFLSLGFIIFGSIINNATCQVSVTNQVYTTMNNSYLSIPSAFLQSTSATNYHKCLKSCSSLSGCIISVLNSTNSACNLYMYYTGLYSQNNSIITSLNSNIYLRSEKIDL